MSPQEMAYFIEQDVMRLVQVPAAPREETEPCPDCGRTVTVTVDVNLSKQRAQLITRRVLRELCERGFLKASAERAVKLLY